MNKTWKALCLSVAALGLTASVSSCSAKWSEVTDFLSDVYTSIEGSWEGAQFEYTETYSHKEKTYKSQYSIKARTTYTQGDSGSIAALDYQYHSRLNDNGEKTNTFIREAEYISGGRLYSLSKLNREVDYSSYKETTSFGNELNNFSTIITYTIATYSSATAEELAITSATIGKRSVSWTVYDREEPLTITLKTDRHYVVNYLSFETSYTDKSSYVKEKMTHKMVFKKVSGGSIHKPSWVNKKNFPRYIS